MSAVLITGGHSGIGLAAARDLAARQVDLILAGRSPSRMQAVAEELRAAHGVRVSTLPVDTSSLASVRAAAAQLDSLLSAGDDAELDAVLCNAGGRFDGPISYSTDGYETTFATNCLGHFLLVELLLPHLSGRGRVVFTASTTHDPDTVDGKMVGAAVEPDAVALARNGKGGSKALSAGKRYATSKLCTVMYAYELDRLLRRAGTTLSANAYDPGGVPETGFLRGMPRPVRWIASTRVMKGILRRMGAVTSDVAFSGASLADLAVAPEYAGVSGKYFQASSGTLSAVPSARMSYDERRAAKLWNDSRELVGLTATEDPAQLR